jgi:glycosyltransferase involved in cell wall biosynthesis
VILKKIRHKIRTLTTDFEVRILKQRAHRHGYDVKLKEPVRESEIVIENFFRTSYSKNALISYIVYPFIDKVKNYHSNNQECFAIAEILKELEFNVDIIHWDNTTYLPKKNYNLVIDNHNNLERLLPFLTENATKIFHATNAHWLYQNWVEFERYYDFFLQKAISIPPPRIMTPANSAEYSDFISIFGNDFTKSTYGRHSKKMHQLPMSVTTIPEINIQKDFSAARTRFVWLNSHGALLKGLDIVIDAFTMLPHLDLYICGDLERDATFRNTLGAQLSKAANIKTVGWVEVDSSLFKKITSECAWVLSTSFSEGGGGSTLNCMAKGLIPVVTRTVSLTLPEETGFYLENNNSEDLADLLSKISTLEDSVLRKMSRNAFEFVSTNHTIENFKTRYKEFLIEVLAA